MSGTHLPSALPLAIPTSSPIATRSRRDSTVSSIISVPYQADKEQLAQTLDKIHTSANQPDVLTTFNDLAPPPDSSTSPENKGFAGDLVQNGFSGLYSRFKEAVGVAGKAQDEGDSQDTASKRSSSTAATIPKTSISSIPRIDTGLTNSTFASMSSTPTRSDPPSGALPPEGTSQQQQQSSARASSVTGLAAPSTSKSASSSRQSIPNMTKATAALAPVTVNAFKEGSRSSSRPDDGSIRTAGSRKSLSRPSDSLPPVPGLENRYDVSESKSAAALEKIAVPSRARRDDMASGDANIDSPISPVKSISSATAASVQPTTDDRNLLSPATRSSARGYAKKPAVINRISGSRSGGSQSRSSSLSQGTAEPSTISTAAHHNVRHDSWVREDRPQRIRSGRHRIPGTTTDEGAPEVVNATLEHMRKQVLSKDFWMGDETCKECFHCGAPFSAFRRKHHCRTCGCIFDSRCTSIISGQKFGVQGTLRVCKPCLDIISQRQDGNASDDSGDDSYLPTIFRSNHKSVTLKLPDRDDASIYERTDDAEDHSRSLTTPLMAIPATRRIGESSNRNSAILEIDAPQLSRPSSSRSLKSLAGRPQSSSHRRHHSKHNFLSRFKASPAAYDRAPFRRSANEEVAKKSGLPAFHDDNVIDPDLAPFMSDESSGDEQMSIFQTMAGNEPNPSSFDREKSEFGPYLGGGRRNRLRTQAEKSISGFSFVDNASPNVYPRSSRRRNTSVASASVHHLRSPRPKSAHLRGGPGASTETLPHYDNSASGYAPRLTRSSSMKGEKEPRMELTPASLLHVRKLLQQLLYDSAVPNAAAWERALVPILLKCTTSVDPEVERGDDIDIRHYVKLKKIPGGRPGDTSYVSGVIFTKKLALKSMPRRLANPRVVIVSFPIEYRRHQQHFMSLQPVIDEEKEFLKVIVSRIVNLRPQLVLAEKSVSGLALQYLSEANIAVAFNVKPSVLSAVSRCLETQIISSIDMLSLPVDRFRIGKSIGFEVKTFVNEEIPGRKKTYLFLSGNQEQLGCTIALRGAPTSVLKKIKRITEFMVYVVYNLKLESCLMRDSYIQMPTSEELPSQLTDESILSLNTLSSSVEDSRHRTASHMTFDDAHSTQDSVDTGIGHDKLTRRDTGLSQATSNKLISLHDTHARASTDSLVLDDAPMPTYYSDMVAKYQTKILSASPFVKFSQPYLLNRAREQERRLVQLRKLRDQDIVEERVDGDKPKPQKFQLIKPQMVHQTGQKAPRAIMEVLHAVHDAEYDKALYNYQMQTRQWENYIQANLDLFEPYAHQNIVVLHSVVCTETKVPCVEPGLIAIAFYDEHAEHNGSLDPDCTLGQYVEDVCFGADSTCTGTSCDRKMYEHHRTYVHGEARITIFIEQDTRGKPHRENIMMWSYCKICKRETAEMEMSKGTWKYSFGKYLELSFWSRGTRLVKSEDEDGWDCPHDHHRDHIRYFGLQDKVMRVHHDPIDLLEIIVPRTRITWKVEHDLNLKNEIFTTSKDRWTRFTTSVQARIKAIKLDNIAPEKAEGCKAETERLTKKIQDEHTSLVRKLQDAYMNSKYYEVIPLNVILREMLEKVSEWDGAFAKFEVDFLPTEKDLRRLTMLQLRKMFTDDSKESLVSNESSNETPSSTEKSSQTTVPEIESKPDTQLSEKDPSHTAPNLGMAPPEALSQETSMDLAKAVLDRVEPLDLATPKSPSQGLLNLSASQSIDATPLAPEASEAIPTFPFASPSTPTAAPETPGSVMSVTEQVEELRRRQQSVVLEEASKADPGEGDSTKNNLDSPRVGIPERISSRRMGLTVSPPMVRALSQPAHSMPTLPRSQSAMGKKLFSLGKDKDKTPSSETPPELSTRKMPATESIKGDKKIFTLRSRNSGKSSIPRFVGKKKDTRVSTLARHFEQLSREFEKERRKDEKQRAAKMSHSRAFLQRSTTRAIVEVYEDPDEAVHEPGASVEDSLMDKDPSTTKMTKVIKHDDNLPSDPTEPAEVPQSSQVKSNEPAEETATEAETDDQTRNTSQAASDDEQEDSDTENSLLEGSVLEEIADSIDSSTEIPIELPKQDKMNFMKVLTNFWAERSASEWPSLDYPLNATDHIFLDSDIIVREDEPSSLIAFALNCEDYRIKAKRFHGRKLADTHESATDTEEEPISSASVYPDNPDFVNDDALEASFVRETSSHLKYQFNEGSARMLVKIFYAEQFDALRRKCGVAHRIVESLSRCLKFDSKGGKTKSVFLKTQDDRLMMKSLSPIETSAFLRFAPSYFGIMAEALFHDLPSVIAKMLGFFQVIIKNPVTNIEIKLDLLLMENLFYDRAPTRIFDLKGSMRNRKIQSTGEQNEVLLDENMVEYIYESPLFAREHSKKLLRASVWNDTLFLARQNVMDYSLMIAVDEAKKELVVGIIDCIRTYTWDKTLESWIKGRGFAGGGRNRPTVTSPKEYKSRFREAMARYILQAPNCWHQFNVPLVASRPHAEINVAGDEASMAQLDPE
ncbi:1-phosphatidylinositol-3-phosphate 5-kinase FAB1 [Xylariales sp. AK1849]|nr:1-phosphatidylinositol-3-phosphate 5-kinase FAB1 [Xylariales sp. AK1849]